MKVFGRKSISLFFCGLVSILVTSAASGQNMFRKVNDFDGDGKADFAITRNIGDYKYWYIWQSSAGFRVSQWGLATDENASGDYDGDGKYDPAIFRVTAVPPSANSYSFWVLGSQIGVLSIDLGATTRYSNHSLAQDYNGDGKTDFAYSSISTNVLMDVFYTSGGFNRVITTGGTLGRIGDMGGDGKADVFSYNPTNYVATIQTYGTGTRQSLQFGVPGDEYVAADFDGDSKGDLTVFRQTDGTWWWLRSSDNVINAATFGTAGDVPVPADYDNDGKTDLAIWRAGTQSYYWVYGSQVGVFALPWGVSGDTVVRY